MSDQSAILVKDAQTFTIKANNQTMVLTRRQMNDILKQMPVTWLKR